MDNYKPTLSGARILWECLEREGVTYVFGYPGGAILPAYDALKHSSIHHILVRHEQGARSRKKSGGSARIAGRAGGQRTVHHGVAARAIERGRRGSDRSGFGAEGLGARLVIHAAGPRQ